MAQRARLRGFAVFQMGHVGLPLLPKSDKVRNHSGATNPHNGNDSRSPTLER